MSATDPPPPDPPPEPSKATNLDEGLKQAGDEVTALAPKCKDSVASAGG